MKGVLLRIVTLALVLTAAVAQEELGMPSPPSEDRCAVVVVNALAVNVSIDWDVDGEVANGLDSGECQLIYIPCEQDDRFPFEVPVTITTPDNPDYVILVPFDTRSGGESLLAEGRPPPQTSARFVHYLVLSHRIRLPHFDNPADEPQNLVATFPFLYEGNELAVALLYERAELPSEPLGENEVGLAFWHVAAGAPFALRIELSGLTGATQQMTAEGGTPPPTPSPDISIVLGPYERETWQILSLPEQMAALAQGLQAEDQEIGLTIEPAVGQQEVASALSEFAGLAAAAGGGGGFQQDIEDMLRESVGQLLTVFIITDPPELGREAVGGRVTPRIFFESCATEALGGGDDGGIVLSITPEND